MQERVQKKRLMELNEMDELRLDAYANSYEKF